ncbi:MULTISPECIES: RlmE family RNA methyltransferase [Aquaspirillum]|jgi:23S rRNA (uridine2552-2'-O)-methyltransferase|uniref:RlmE family RNA methyltransferase n=1 Tax=Aquaspirillum serpens TaxID=190 RepID=UPI0003B4678F|nr:RlmE family RNA methyltransferase [Aquaspirillum serpens]MBP7970586.1 RlmE family RNA methyltransferase [Aquaspirillum sp.]
MARSKSSAAWLNEHVHDHWVQQAQKDGYRARAAYKLLEINEKDHLIRPGMMVADLGSAPGSWSQVAARILDGRGQVFALDILPMDPVPGVEFIQGDFREDVVLNQFLTLLADRPLDLVLCDIAPNMSGNRTADQARSAHLVELALDFAQTQLKPGGNFLVKVFQGSEFASFLAAMRQSFTEVISRKPKASRDRSSEVYLLGRGRR